MKVRLLEHYQDRKMHLAPGQELDVSDTLGAWLVKHKKAVQIFDTRHLDVEPQFEVAEEPPHYGAQAEPELRDDANKYQNVKKPRRGRGAK